MCLIGQSLQVTHCKTPILTGLVGWRVQLHVNWFLNMLQFTTLDSCWSHVLNSSDLLHWLGPFYLHRAGNETVKFYLPEDPLGWHVWNADSDWSFLLYKQDGLSSFFLWKIAIHASGDSKTLGQEVICNEDQWKHGITSTGKQQMKQSLSSRRDILEFASRFFEHRECLGWSWE